MYSLIFLWDFSRKRRNRTKKVKHIGKGIAIVCMLLCFFFFVLSDRFPENLLKIFEVNCIEIKTFKCMWNVYGCDTGYRIQIQDTGYLAVLNFFAAFDLLEKMQERSLAEYLNGGQRSRLLFKRSTVTEKYGLQVLLPSVQFHMLWRTHAVT